MLPIESFTYELCKIALKATPKSRAQTAATKHFESADPNWHAFEKNLKLKTFQQVVAGHPQADEKLKKYVDNYGGYLLSKKTTARVVGDSGKTYVVKELPGGRMGCNCGNWQYRRSVDGGDCKHITSIVGNGMKKLSANEVAINRGIRALGEDLAEVFAKHAVPLKKKADMVKLSMAKQALMTDLINAGGTLALQNNRMKKGVKQGRASSAANAAYRQALYNQDPT